MDVLGPSTSHAKKRLNPAGKELLEDFYASNRRPDATQRIGLAEQLRQLGNSHVTDKTVYTWFANRRAQRAPSSGAHPKPKTQLSALQKQQVDTLLAAIPHPTPEIVASWTAFGLDADALRAHVHERALQRAGVLTPLSASPELPAARSPPPPASPAPPPRSPTALPFPDEGLQLFFGWPHAAEGAAEGAAAAADGSSASQPASPVSPVSPAASGLPAEMPVDAPRAPGFITFLGQAVAAAETAAPQNITFTEVKPALQDLKALREWIANLQSAMDTGT